MANLTNYSTLPSFLPIFTISITFSMQMDFNSPKFFLPNFLQSLFTKLFTTKGTNVFLLYGSYMPFIPHIRVESGSDDPDYLGHLGHFFDGSGGSYSQTKLSGCDPDF